MSASKSRDLWINSDGAFLDLLAAQIANGVSSNCISAEARETLVKTEGQLNVVANVLEASTAMPDRTMGEADASLGQGEASQEMDAMTTLFRARCLLYENSIRSDLFANNDEDELTLVSPYVVDQTVAKLESSRLEHNSSLPHARHSRAGDEDYDDDDDDDDNDERQGPEADGGHRVHEPQFSSGLRNTDQANGITNEKYKSQQFGDAAHSGGIAKPQVLDQQAHAERNRRNEDSTLNFELNSQYHTLEYDRHAMKEQTTLEASDRQVENDIDPTGRENLRMVNFGAANLSLKHLISKIDQSRDKLALTDNELRALLSEVRKNRSKWANEEKIGQEELYEAAERVVIELRGYTEHSTAFLNKVTKRDVPDYYNIIKQPMDLGTLMKNLKNLQYKSKADFAADVMLIWDNCLTYNADAAHPLRKHAFAMRRKSEQLLAMVPDVTIKDRSEAEAEEFGLVENDQEEDDEDQGKKPFAGMSTRGTFGPKSLKSKKASKTVVNGEDTTDVNGLDIKQQADTPVFRSPEPMTEAQKSLPTEDNLKEVEGTADPAGSELEDVDEGDADFQIWKTRTKKSRADYASMRHRLFRQDVLYEDDIACQITPESLGRDIMQHQNVIYTRNGEELGQRHAEDLSTSINSNSNFKIPAYELCSVPDVWQTTGDFNSYVRSFQVQSLVEYEPKPDGLNEKAQSTALEMKSIRHLCTKLSTLKLMQDPMMNAFPASYFRQLMEADSPLIFKPIELEQSGIDAVRCSEDLGRALLQKSCSHLLYLAGFEDFQSQALLAFTELAGGFLQTLGKLMKQYSEAREKHSQEEILRHTLYEIGVSNLDVLEDYVTDDIVGKQEKIGNLHLRLKKFLNDFIHGTADVDGEKNGQNLFSEDNQDAFVSGSFGEETGEDFFGFRELGLEKEFGMSSLSVPLRLLQGRLRPSNVISSTLDGENQPGIRFDRKFPHITKQLISRQIGLFRPYLEAKFDSVDDEDGNALVEDEELPIRQRKPKPRLGPSGKITSAMKRPLRDPNTSPSKKRKKTTDVDTEMRDSEVPSPSASVS